MSKPSLGQVILHPQGTNPYSREEHAHASGDGRVAALRQFRDTGTLPAGIVAWSDLDRKQIVSPDEIDWTGLR